METGPLMILSVFVTMDIGQYLRIIRCYVKVNNKHTCTQTHNLPLFFCLFQQQFVKLRVWV